MMLPNDEIKYQSWRDRGGNFGIQCLVCKRVHWTGEEPATDPITGDPCHNCIEIKNSNLRNEAAIEHNVEIADLPKLQEQVAARNKVQPDEAKHEKIPLLSDICKHHMSQPVEDR